MEMIVGGVKMGRLMKAIIKPPSVNWESVHVASV